jgi:hypothetical protein
MMQTLFLSTVSSDFFQAAPQIGELMPADQKVSGAKPGRFLPSRREDAPE